jgi:hypothetical protein
VARALAVLLIVAAVGGGARRVSAQPLILGQQPFLGLACEDQRYPCPRVGLGVWLPRPARSVAGLVDGHSLRLLPILSGGRSRRPIFWQTFFVDTRAESVAGDMTRSVDLELFVVFGDGARFIARTASPISSGYC